MCVSNRLPHPGTLVLIVIGLIGQSIAKADELKPEYLPGQGWQVPGTELNIGGYVTASFDDIQNAPAAFAIDDLSLFARWEGRGKLRLFSELTLESPVVYEPENDANSQHAYLALERFYGDYLHADGLNFRAGKFLTPIGRWNVAHAGPLEWTTSRPLITERSFPTNTTGVMLFGTVPILGKIVDYSVYSALGNDWRPDPRLDPFSEAYGLHISVAVSSSVELGMSVVKFEQRDEIGEHRRLFGLDCVWSHNRYEVSAEATYRSSQEGRVFSERGLFVQGVAPLSRRLYAVGRYEYFDQAGPQRPVNSWLLGLALKLSPALILKLEFREGANQPTVVADGVMGSVSFLF